jgi:hypothetical protein
MPNWCNNSVVLKHNDPAMIERARKAFNGEGLLQEFIPVPQALRDTVSGSMGEDKREAHEAQQKANVEQYGYANWYDFCVNEWGTKWEIGADGNPAQDIPGGLMLGFDSAWSPPIAAYEKLLEMGFEIEAMYYEPGMAYAGVWDNGHDDYYEYGGLDSAGIAETLPAELDEAFGISESVAEWEAEQEEENIDIDLDGGLSAINEQEQQK